MRIGYSGKKSGLAKSFINQYKKKFIFKCYKKNISNKKGFDNWIKKNNDLNIFINFAAITSPKKCNMNKKKSFDTNYISVVNMLKIINRNNIKNFKYFLCLSSSHVFKKSKKKLNEKSKREPSNYYGYTKKLLEDYVLKNQNKFYYNIGIARIFNFYNKLSNKNFFINDVLKKLNSNKKKIYFENINTFRDFLSMSDINSALYLMIKLQLINDFNICSGKKIKLKDIIIYLSKMKQNKKDIIFDNKSSKDLIGSNIKLKKKGWKIKYKNFFNQLN